MTISEIKTQIGLQSLTMVRQLNKDTKAKEPWLSHWDNDKRIRVTMHEEVLAQIKSQENFGGLAYKTELVPQEGERKPYTRIVVITPTNIEACL